MLGFSLGFLRFFPSFFLVLFFVRTVMFCFFVGSFLIYLCVDSYVYVCLFCLLEVLSGFGSRRITGRKATKETKTQGKTIGLF